jgi:hypothetical protein
MSKEAARELVQRFFTPKYAEAITRCPCDGNCIEGPGAACETLSESTILRKGTSQLPVITPSPH